jgi:FKBP-type peptidyl-prolyl cis-trans isomerase (trigger factor)
LDSEPKFYTQWGLNIFRYIATYYDTERDTRAIAQAGDKLELRYSAYIFNNSKPTIDNLFATNDEARIAELEAKGLNTSYEWTTEPLEAILGQGDILEGLEIAIEGCREGDSIEVYLTFESGYGNKYVGMVPGKSAQVWYIDILKVTKK